MKLPVWGLGALFMCAACVCPAQDTVRDPATGITFPKLVSVDIDGKDHPLQATGVATRKKLFVKVYSVAHYMEDAQKAPPEQAYEQILTAKKIKQLSLQFVRDVPVDKIQEGYRESFSKAFSATELGQFRPQIDQFLGFFDAPIKNGDTQTVQWFPDGKIVVEVNGTEKGTISNEGFARGLWSVWFGKSPVVNRKDLVSLLQ